MELRLVYRILRKISDWTISGYYSDVHIEGAENVPNEGPVIFAATHHNEIIDIATLAASVPHRRHVCFWAKSTMFNNPIARQILESSGAIPVKRNPDGVNGNGASKQDLFKSTSIALVQDQVVGIFPEGTSYTQPCIVQLMSGVAHAAVEYTKYERERNMEPSQKDAVLVPVAIVYTDKANFQSRIIVQYGRPLTMGLYTKELFGSEDLEQASRNVVRSVMAETEAGLYDMTINARDWETLYAANTARQILWNDDDNIQSKDWVYVSQKLVDIFAGQTQSISRTKPSLTKYFSLLHYAGLTHATVEQLIPSSLYRPSRRKLLQVLLTPSFHTILTFPKSLLETLLFIPPFITHLPGYIFGSLVEKFLATPGEEEGVAQYRAVGCGIGLGLYFPIVGKVMQRTMLQALINSSTIFKAKILAWSCLGGYERVEGFMNRVLDAFNARTSYQSLVESLSSLIQPKLNAFLNGWLGRTLSLIGFGWFMVKWHGFLVKGNHKRYKKLLARYHLLMGILQPQTSSLTKAEVDERGYTRLPPPPTNAFIRRKHADAGSTAEQPRPPKSIPPRKLVMQLLAQKQEAMGEVRRFFLDAEPEQDVDRLKQRGARIPAIA